MKHLFFEAEKETSVFDKKSKRKSERPKAADRNF